MTARCKTFGFENLPAAGLVEEIKKRESNIEYLNAVDRDNLESHKDNVRRIIELKKFLDVQDCHALFDLRTKFREIAMSRKEFRYVDNNLTCMISTKCKNVPGYEKAADANTPRWS